MYEPRVGRNRNIFNLGVRHRIHALMARRTRSRQNILLSQRAESFSSENAQKTKGQAAPAVAA